MIVMWVDDDGRVNQMSVTNLTVQFEPGKSRLLRAKSTFFERRDWHRAQSIEITEVDHE